MSIILCVELLFGFYNHKNATSSRLFVVFLMQVDKGEVAAVLLVCKWGGEMTHAGIGQARQYAPVFWDDMYVCSCVFGVRACVALISILVLCHNHESLDFVSSLSIRFLPSLLAFVRNLNIFNILLA